jgi:uncharacterized protein with FMN-binding domain
MRRTFAAIGLTVIGMWLVLTFKSSPPPRVNASANTTSPTTTATAPPDTSGQPPGGASPPGSGSTTSTAPATTTTALSAKGQRTVTGDVVPNQYGNVQVALVFQGTQIVDVKALQMPFDRARSQDISTQAAPLLHDEVIQAQSANIDTLGGATFTSEAYAQSVQSAIDRSHG